MGNSLAGIGMDFNRSQFMARQRIESQINLPRLFAAIDADPGIVGAGVVYIDADFNVITLREFKPICSIKPKRIILREAQKYISPAQFVEQVKTDPREGRLQKEAFDMGLSCSAAVIGWIVVFSGSVAVPFTAGASAFVVGIGITAALASSAQCGFGVARTYNEVLDPDANDRMDDAAWYGAVSPLLDAASLVGIGTGALTTIRLLKANKAAALGKSWYELLKGLSRQERKKLTKELLSLKDPSLTPKLLKLQQRAGTLTKSYSSTEIRHATLTQLKDAIGGLLGIWGSHRTGHVGTAETIAIGLYEDLTE